MPLQKELAILMRPVGYVNGSIPLVGVLHLRLCPLKHLGISSHFKVIYMYAYTVIYIYIYIYIYYIRGIHHQLRVIFTTF